MMGSLLAIFFFWQIVGNLSYLAVIAITPSWGVGMASLVLMYGTFIFLLIGVWLAAKYMLHLPIVFLIGKVNHYKRYFFLTIFLFAFFLGLDVLLCRDCYQLTGGWDTLGKVLLLSPLILLAAFAEELFFRGVFYTLLLPYKNGDYLAIIIPSIFFAALHGLNAEMALSIGMPLYYFVMGAFLASIRYFTGGITSSTAVHFGYNLMTIACLAYPSSTMAAFGMDSLLYRTPANVDYVASVTAMIFACYLFYQVSKQKGR